MVERRSFLALLAGGVATATCAVAVNAVPVKLNADAELFALAKAARKAHAETRRIWKADKPALTALMAQIPGVPECREEFALGDAVVVNASGEYDLASEYVGHLRNRECGSSLERLVSDETYRVLANETVETERSGRVSVVYTDYEIPPAVRQRATEIARELEAIEVKRDAIWRKVRRIEDRGNRAVDAAYRAAKMVLKCPANTIEGVREKLRIAEIAGLVEDHPGPVVVLRAITGDLRRISASGKAVAHG